MTTAADVSVSLPKEPYRGIEPFRYVDEPIFFARDEEIQELLHRIIVYRGVLFYGDSGSGKSSLINAGLIPAMTREGFTAERLRVQPIPGEEIIVERIRTTDSREPFLPSNLVDDEQTIWAVKSPGGDISTRCTLSIDDFKRRIQWLPSDQRPLLIFDQFEELITLFEEGPSGEALKRAEIAQAAVLGVLGGLLRSPTLPVKLLFAFREDYLAKFSKLFALCPNLLDQYLRLTPPSTAALPEIIRGSFEKFPGRFRKELSEGLTRDLTVAITKQATSNRLNLSEVQIVCLKLWESDDPESLFKEKGVQGLLEVYLFDSLNRLPGHLRYLAVVLLSRMVTPSGTRKLVSKDDLITQVSQEENLPQDGLQAALRALVQATKLVLREERYNTDFYVIVSEYLVPWISRKKEEMFAETERRKRRKLQTTERLKRRRAYLLAGLLGFGVVAVGLILIVIAWLLISSQKAAMREQASRDAKLQEAQRTANYALTQKDAVEGEKDNLNNQVTDLDEQLKMVRGERDNLRKERDKLRASNKEKDQQIESMDNKITELREELKKRPKEPAKPTPGRRGPAQRKG